MRILVADDGRIDRYLLEQLLHRGGHEVVAVEDGIAALNTLQQADAPPMALLDWMMPGITGIEVCRQAREHPTARSTYIILVSARDTKDDIATALREGANDFVVKPFNATELEARVNVGVRTVELQQALAARVRELEQALALVRQLQGLLPICSYCKKIRDDHNYWSRVEEYFTAHAPVQFTHGICPDCYKTMVEPELAALERQAAEEEKRHRGE